MMIFVKTGLSDVREKDPILASKSSYDSL